MTLNSLSSQTDFNVVVVGGGIQGIGVLHDLASRGYGSSAIAFEEKKLSSGTSSRSTKLVHGGLRYLEQFSNWPLVREALQERTLLLKLLPNLVKPVPFLLPSFKNTRPAWMVKLGLFLYDTIGGNTGLPKSKSLTHAQAQNLAPYLKLNSEQIAQFFLYFDAQMLDDVIVRVAAKAANKLGSNHYEMAQVVSVKPKQNSSGYFVEVRMNGSIHTLSTKVVINASGAWNNANLLRWNIVPKTHCLLNIGSHLCFHANAVPADPEKSAATLLQNEDGRVVFFIPWFGSWLFGTTESILSTSPSKLVPPVADKQYLIESIQSHVRFQKPIEECISEFFSGVRTMPLQMKNSLTSKSLPSKDWCNDPFESPYYVKNLDSSISKLSRETVICEALPQLFSIYGGKYTTYRSQSEKLGNKISNLMNVKQKSKTHRSESWFLRELQEQFPEIFRSQTVIRQTDSQ
jgi:glycerol-3-phosphate dehydrogenase